MNFGVMFDVAASVLAVMILFSLAASAINEIVADNLLNLRGKTLNGAIRQLLAKKTDLPGDAQTRAERFFEDPDIRALMKGARTPSAIEPRRYALTVLNLAGRREALTVTAAAELAALRAEALAVVGGAAAGGGAAADLAAGVERAIDRASAQAAAFRTTLDREVGALEAEFDEAMDRVSGWYLRRTKWNLFAIGLILAVGANMDILRYADRMMTETAARERAATYADLLGQQWQIAELAPAGDGRTAAASTTATDAAPEATAGPDPREAVTAEFAGLVENLNKLDVRVGWECRPLPEARLLPGLDRWRAGSCPAGTGFVLPSPSQAMGWLIIAVGVTLGAQFWFDLFQRLAGMRTAGLTGGAAVAASERAVR